MKILYEDDIMPIGCYRDMIIEDIINIDAKYIKTFNKQPFAHNVAISDEVLKDIVVPNMPRTNHVAYAIAKSKVFNKIN